MVLRILIANCQPIIRHGLRAFTVGEPDWDVIGETDDGGEGVRLARQLRPDVVRIDLSIPTIGGTLATQASSGLDLVQVLTDDGGEQRDHTARRAGQRML
jgi:DNA-binding NarL/FixJ family response regulator